MIKLTDENMKTYGNTQWKLGERKTAPGVGPLCSVGWLHCYDDPWLAMLMNPVHANFALPRMFVGDAGTPTKSDGTKRGVSSLTITAEITPPEISTAERVTFSIICVAKVYFEPDWVKWAGNWLSGQDRSYAAAAHAAANAASAYDAAYDAANAAANDAAAYDSAYDAANAAANAAKANRNIDLVAAAHFACGVEAIGVVNLD